MKLRIALTLAASSTALAFAPNAFGQDAADETDTSDAIIVTGTRVEGRSRLDTASPVDVITAKSLKQQGTTELATALATVTPSIDFPRPAVTDGTDAIRPATLRGMSPDQTLVLINGVRGHTSALLNINGSVGRGSAAVDLNTVPSTALQSIEVLRDGASAQYGSDAISGVVNLRLREDNSGGGAAVTYGFHETQVDTSRGSRHVTGESTVTVAGWQGVSLGADGFLTVSGEYSHRNPTSRGGEDPRLDPPAVNSRYGDPEVDQYAVYANAGMPIGDSWELYGWAGYQDRESQSAAFPRLLSAYNGNGVETIYPNGFLPLIQTNSRDLTLAGGVRGDLGGWNVDVNASYGRNKIKFHTVETANYSFGAGTQTSFYDGALIYDQLVGGVDVSKTIDMFQSLNVAFGVEGRREGYTIEAGEEASYSGSGAQGFPGFAPENEISKHRTNASAYIDIEAQLTDKFLLGIAGRGEDYSDFGTTATGKISARYDFTPSFAIRGTASTGFRAPSLQQSYFTSVASVIQDGNVILTGTFPATSGVAQALGGKALEPEKSTNLSAGFVFRSGGFDLTVDAYRIHVRDQIGLSEIIRPTSSSDPADQAFIAALLAENNASAARFFINGLATTTKGIDAVAHYRLVTDKAGTFDLTVAGNINDVKVTRVPTTTAVTSTLNDPPALFVRSRILTMTDGTPGEKVTGSVVWSGSNLGATARVTYYGNVLQPGTTEAADNWTGKRAITDIELRYEGDTGLDLAIGANNLFDVYPRQIPAERNPIGLVSFPFYSPFGFNGRYVYVRAGLSW